MKLTESQKQVLHAVLLSAEKSTTEVARTLHMTSHTVRRTISMFLDKGIFIRRCVFVDPHSLGMTVYLAQLSLPSATLAERESFRKLLCESEQSGAVVELGGGGEFEVRIFARGPAHLTHFFESLATQSYKPFFIRSCLLILESEYFGRVEGLPPSSSDRALSFHSREQARTTYDLDEKDHVVLSALSNYHYLNLQEVSRALGMPYSSLQYRVEKLEASGIIQGHFYIMDPKIFGDLPFALKVVSRALTSREREKVTSFCKRHPLISWITFFVGEQTVEIYTLVRSFDGAQSVLSDLSAAFGDMFDSVQVRPQLSFHKISNYPFKKFLKA